MRDYFFKLLLTMERLLQNNEVYLSEFTTEQSHFIHFNKGRIIQSGRVEQRYLEIELIQGKRHITKKLALCGNIHQDRERITTVFSELRDDLPQVPEDPYLLYATDVQSTASPNAHLQSRTNEVLAEILEIIREYDFVGLYAVGSTFTGFANSLGQRNWHSSYGFNFDWSLYHDKDKAVKSAYADFYWETTHFQNKMVQSIAQLELLKRKPRTIEPGKYRVYLAPSALYEILQLLAWESFGFKSQRSKESSLLRMLEEPAQRLHPSITLTENIADGITPPFQSKGFIKPAQVPLIKEGVYQSALVSPRSAQEFGVNTNGANDDEIPTSYDLAAGEVAQTDILKTLDTGVYVNNLWYTNFSDRAACRITGMTRFATFWVENGEIIAPLNVMRFDETLYNMLGDKLIGLTSERDFILETDTYEKRSTNSARIPGVLVEDFIFTL